MPFELIACLLDRELPVDRDAFEVALVDPSEDLLLELMLAGDTALETLPGQGRELDFNHIEPACAFRGEVHGDTFTEGEGVLGV